MKSDDVNAATFSLDDLPLVLTVPCGMSAEVRIFGKTRTLTARLRDTRFMIYFEPNASTVIEKSGPVIGSKLRY